MSVHRLHDARATRATRSVMTWAASPAYGQSVALGPTQRAVLDVALRMTTHGRRPDLTLGRLAALTGRPVSSVHEALGRLRALGLLGVSARMGRHGGHRLWRVRRSAGRALDVDLHRRAIARMVRRFGAFVSQAAVAGGVSQPTGTAPGSSGRTRSQADALPGGGANRPTGPTRQLHGEASDPSSQGAPDTAGTRVARPETFAAKMRRYGLRPDIIEREVAE